jgi:hypothetical protein
MNWELAGKIASAIVVVGGVVFMVFRALKERRAQAGGLKKNPTRCIEAEKRIVAVELCQAKTEVELRSIKEKIEGVGADVKTLIDLHLSR